MSIIKNERTINEVNINNLNISKIYKGSILIYSSLIQEFPNIVFRDIDETGNLNLASGSLTGLFDNVKTISNYGLAYAFNGCTGITGSINFPLLTSVGTRGLYYAFNDCTGITEIHFRADAKSAIETTEGYSNNFGASNSTIYFDL